MHDAIGYRLRLLFYTIMGLASNDKVNEPLRLLTLQRAQAQFNQLQEKGFSDRDIDKVWVEVVSAYSAPARYVTQEVKDASATIETRRRFVSAQLEFLLAKLKSAKPLVPGLVVKLINKGPNAYHPFIRNAALVSVLACG